MRVVAWDLECTSLSGMIGRILCCSFKEVLPDGSGKVWTFRGDDKRFRNSKDIVDDGALAIAIRDELEKYDVIIGHNSKLFDKKFLQARLMKAGAHPKRSQWHLDTMWIIRSNMRVSSKLDNIQKFLGLPDEKTPISWDDWMRGGAFDKKSMDVIVQHCEQDVRVLEETYWKVLPFARNLQRD